MEGEICLDGLVENNVLSKCQPKKIGGIWSKFEFMENFGAGKKEKKIRALLWLRREWLRAQSTKAFDSCMKVA